MSVFFDVAAPDGKPGGNNKFLKLTTAFNDEPARSGSEVIIHRDEPVFQRAYVCRGVFKTKEWLEAASAVCEETSENSCSLRATLEKETKRILSKKGLADIIHMHDKTHSAKYNQTHDSRSCLRFGAINSIAGGNCHFDSFEGLPEDPDLGKESIFSAVFQTLVAVVALKKVAGTRFFLKEKSEIVKATTDCRDSENQKPVREFDLNAGDLNLHTKHGTCHQAPHRPCPTGVMLLYFNIPYSKFDDVIDRLTTERSKKITIDAEEEEEEDEEEEEEEGEEEEEEE